MNTLKINEATDRELTTLIELCHFMFHSHGLNDRAVSSFMGLLRSKFSLMTFGRIEQLCTEVAANPPKPDIRLTPSFLATILYSRSRQEHRVTYIEKVISEAEKIKYRQEFLKDLSIEFEKRKTGEKPGTHIRTWQYVAELIVRSGFAERLPKVREFSGEMGSVEDIFLAYQPFVLECFDKIIADKKHISDYIHGI